MSNVKTQTKQKKGLSISQDFKEFAIVGVVMTLVLLPVRLVFVEFVSDSTLGSFGVITAISILMIVLVKKNKLGKFGQIFERQMFRITRGKKRIFSLTMITMSLLTFGFMLYAIELGNTVYFEEKEQIKEVVLAHFGVEFDSFENINEATEVLSVEAVAGGMPAFADATVNDFKAIAITEAIVNDMSHGMIQHFSIVFFIEQVEILGVFIYYSLVFRKKGKEQEQAGGFIVKSDNEILKAEKQEEIKDIELLQDKNEPKPKKNRFRIKLLFACMLGFTVALQVGSMFAVDQAEAEAFIAEISEKVKNIDGIGIFLHNTSLSLLMFVPFGGALWGVLTASQTGLAYSALVTVEPSLSFMPAVGLLYLSPFGLMEVFAYSIAMSRSLILGHRILKRQVNKLELKHLAIDVGILVALLFAGGIIEMEMINWASDMGISNPIMDGAEFN